MSATDSTANVEVISNSAAKRVRKYGPRTTALDAISDVDLTGQTILITGTTSGIGTETARALALKGAHVVMANRNIVQAEALKCRILAEKPDAKIDLIVCDLSSLQSVEAAINEYKNKQWPLHVLILNAGVFSPAQKMTIDGLEMSFAVNHVAHQYIVRELLPLLRQSYGRIVVVSSQSHNHTGVVVLYINPQCTPALPVALPCVHSAAVLKREMTVEEKLARLCPTQSSEFGYRLYAYSKLCNVLMAMKLHRNEFCYGISVYVLHPGSMIGTEISRSYGLLGKLWNAVSKPFTKSLEQGAATTVYCAASPDVHGISGKYWESCWDDEKNLDVQLVRDEQLQDALWEKTDKLLNAFEASRQPVSTVSKSDN